MKILYLSQLPFTDCDFPLIKEFQKKKVDVDYYIQIFPYNKKTALFNLEKLYPKNGIFKASVYSEFRAYANYFDLNRVYVVNCLQNSSLHPKTVFLYLKLFFRILFSKIDILHITWPLMRITLPFHFFKKKLVLTLHDPFVHSGKKNQREFEFCRKLCFKRIRKILMLNSRMCDAFSKSYNYPKNQIFVSKMGSFDHLLELPSIASGVKQPFILFFGYISPYKGVEFLLEAMKIVHEKYPNIKLVIAGSGTLYFEKSLYENVSFVEIRNRYITVPELTGLLKECLFTVCPYKDATQSGVVQTAFTLDVPIVATDVGALGDSIIDGKNGLLVPPKDSLLLAKAIECMVGDGELVADMKEYIRTHWKPNMEWGNICEQYLDCYTQK